MKCEAFVVMLCILFLKTVCFFYDSHDKTGTLVFFIVLFYYGSCFIFAFFEQCDEELKKGKNF